MREKSQENIRVNECIWIRLKIYFGRQRPERITEKYIVYVVFVFPFLEVLGFMWRHYSKGGIPVHSHPPSPPPPTDTRSNTPTPAFQLLPPDYSRDG
jgi:hypothetical protein